MDRFGISAAIERAQQAIEAGMVRVDDGMAFAEWLTDEYRDEERSYVDGVPTSTPLWALFGGSVMARPRRRVAPERASVAIGYVRVSTEEQAREGVSLEAQAERIERWAKDEGYELAEIHRDAGLSAKDTDNRPGILAALEAVCARKGVLVVYSLSRVSRSTRDMLTIAERLEDAGANLVSLTEHIDTTSAAGNMVFRMLAVLNEFERDQVSERTRSALAFKKSRGEAVGRPPRGLKIVGTELAPDPDSDGLLLVERARTLRDSGMSLQAICDALESEGFKP